jgi:hypothetical protein
VTEDEYGALLLTRLRILLCVAAGSGKSADPIVSPLFENILAMRRAILIIKVIT